MESNAHAALLSALHCPACDGSGSVRDDGCRHPEDIGSRFNRGEWERCEECDGLGSVRGCEGCSHIHRGEENGLLQDPGAVVWIDGGGFSCGACSAEWIIAEVVGLLTSAAKEAA